MATRSGKKSTRRKGASRGGRQGSAGWAWFLTGLVLGFGAAAFLFIKGYIPDRPEQQPVADIETPAEEIEPADESEELAADERGNRFDFFTVLPEMEVVVPDQQLDREALSDAGNDSGGMRYMLQAGSFRTAPEAEQRKARLALLGNSATVQVVTVNGETWHRVRIGPIDSARRADEIRRLLLDNGIETLVLRDSP